MERNSFKALETISLQVALPNGEPTDFVIQLQDTEAKPVKRVLSKWNKISNQTGRKGLSLEQKEQFSIEMLCAVIVDWEGFTEQGVEIECSDEEKRKLLTDPALRFVRQQIDDTVGEVSNFLAMNGSN